MPDTDDGYIGSLVIIGGCGYCGLRLAERLLLTGDYVRLVDVAPPNPAALQELLEKVLLTRTAGANDYPSSFNDATSSESISSGSDRSSWSTQAQGTASRAGTHQGHGGGSTEFQIQQLGPGLQFVSADLRSKACMATACKGAAAVFHLASTGMSGEESMGEAQFIYDVNVKGTVNVIQACVDGNVPHLVYVSTVNVVFDWLEKINLTEDEASYVNPETFFDTYSVTKSWAEELVLSSNGIPLPSKPGGQEQGFLRTCALRPPGIWGPGELRHTPRILNAAKQGLLLITFGKAQADWIHAENLISAMLLSLEGLGHSRGHIASGKAYFVADGAPSSPTNNFVFFSHFIEGLGYKMPRVRLPWRLVLGLSMCNELLHMALLPLGLRLPLLLCPAEVYKTAVPHFFKIEKAQRELGYAPLDYQKAEAVAWYARNGFAAHSEHQSAPQGLDRDNTFAEGRALDPLAATLKQQTGDDAVWDGLSFHGFCHPANNTPPQEQRHVPWMAVLRKRSNVISQLALMTCVAMAAALVLKMPLLRL